MSRPLKAVIVGLTGIGAARPEEPTDIPLYGAMPTSHASAYHRNESTELVGVCDIRQEALDDFGTRWGDVFPDTRAYTDYAEMLSAESPDIVSVVTGDHLHADITVAAAEGGARAVICEKPIATTLADADRMIEACDRHKVLLSIEHSRRWYSSFQRVRQLIRAGRIGTLRTIVCDLFSTRAMLFRNGTHLLDMICFYAESDPKWVVAELEEGFDHFVDYQGDGGKDPTTDPGASAYIRYENGVRAFFNCRKVNFPGSGLALTGEEGRIEVSDREIQLVTAANHLEWARTTIRPDVYMHDRLGAFVPEIVDALENGRELVSSGREARKTLEIMLGILKSHQAGNVRVDFPLE